MEKTSFKVHKRENRGFKTLEELGGHKKESLDPLDKIDYSGIRTSMIGREDRDGAADIFMIKRQYPGGNRKYPFKIVRSYKARTKNMLFGNKGLRVLTIELIRFFCKNRERDLSLDYVSEQLYIEKRKIYDLINIFSSFKLIRKVGKGNYTWCGLNSMEKKIDSILEEINETGNLVGGTLGGVSDKKERLVKEKSLGVLAFNFIKLLKKRNHITIEQAAELLTKNSDHKKYKTKIRRLYDVSKVLVSVGLIFQIHNNKRSALGWSGKEKMRETIKGMIKGEEEHRQIKKENQYQSINEGTNFLHLIDLMFKGPSIERPRIDNLGRNYLEKRECTEKEEEEEYFQATSNIIFPIVSFSKIGNE